MQRITTCWYEVGGLCVLYCCVTETFSEEYLRVYKLEYFVREKQQSCINSILVPNFPEPAMNPAPAPELLKHLTINSWFTMVSETYV